MGPTNTLVARNEKPNFCVQNLVSMVHVMQHMVVRFPVKREIAFFFPSQAGNSAPMLTAMLLKSIWQQNDVLGKEHEPSFSRWFSSTL